MNSSLRAQLKALARCGALGQRATPSPLTLHHSNADTKAEPQKKDAPCPDTASASPSTI